MPSILFSISSKANNSSVLNLVINGMPSILVETWTKAGKKGYVLNLVINGMPSIP